MHDLSTVLFGVSTAFFLFALMSLFARYNPEDGKALTAAVLYGSTGMLLIMIALTNGVQPDSLLGSVGLLIYTCVILFSEGIIWVRRLKKL